MKNLILVEGDVLREIDVELPPEVKSFDDLVEYCIKRTRAGEPTGWLFYDEKNENMIDKFKTFLEELPLDIEHIYRKTPPIFLISDGKLYGRDPYLEMFDFVFDGKSVRGTIPCVMFPEICKSPHVRMVSLDLEKSEVLILTTHNIPKRFKLVEVILV